MSFNFKTALKPIIWIGKETFHVFQWVPRIVAVIRDSQDAANKIEPKLVATFQTVEALAQFAVADGKQLLPALKTLLEDITALGGAGMVNPIKYLELGSAVNNFIQVAHGLDTTQIVKLVDDLVSEYDDLGAEVKTTLNKLATDVSGKNSLPAVYQAGQGSAPAV